MDYMNYRFNPFTPVSEAVNTAMSSFWNAPPVKAATDFSRGAVEWALPIQSGQYAAQNIGSGISNRSLTDIAKGLGWSGLTALNTVPYVSAARKGITALKGIAPFAAIGGVSGLLGGGGPSDPYANVPLNPGEANRRNSTALRVARQIEREKRANEDEQARVASLINKSGQGGYDTATGLAQQEFKIGKKAARNELRDVLTSLRQNLAGASQDLSTSAAQAGLDTSPAALDVGLDYLAGATQGAEGQARERFAGQVSKLTMDLARQRASAAAARDASRQRLIEQMFLAEQGLLG